MKFETIKNNRDFVNVYNKGKSYVGVYIVMYVLKSSNDDKRIGITVSKKVGKAVIRNRVRRLIKETIIANWSLFPSGYDYVFVARVRSKGQPYEKINKNIRYLLFKFKDSRK